MGSYKNGIGNRRKTKHGLRTLGENERENPGKITSYSLDEKALTKYINLVVDLDDTEINSRDFLKNNINRHLHIKGVYNLMAQLIELNHLEDHRRDLLNLAILHDIGYSYKCKATEFHPVDGYLFCVKNGIKKEISKAVLYHTSAKDLAPDNLKYYYEQNKIEVETETLYTELITLCDTHIDKTGNIVNITDRYKGIVEKYGENNIISTVFKNNLDYYIYLSKKYNM